MQLTRGRRRTALLLVPLIVATGLLFSSRQSKAQADVDIVRSSITAKDGRIFSVTNHLVRAQAAGVNTAAVNAAAGRGKEFLVVWAGDANIADTTGSELQKTPLAVNPVRLANIDAVDAPPAPDFLAVIDADPASPTYGKVVNTGTVSPLVENEPHHMQYLYHKGDKIFAGGLYSDTTYVFDVSKLPLLSLSGVNLPQDTLCGSIPDAYWTLSDHTAYGTYMGGPDVPGPCTYSDGSVRIGNGFGGSPGEIVHIGTDGSTLSEMPAASATGEDPANCPNYPLLPQATCANPHGIQVREDLKRIVASDYAEPRNIVLDPVKPQDAGIFRDTVRTYDITNENRPTLASVSVMPDGPRKERNPGHEEPRGIMETTVTNLPQHRGAFAESMCGGVIYYTPDITAKRPVWREVFDDSTASKSLQPNITEGGGCDGGGWLQTDPTDHYLYHAVIGRNSGALDSYDPGVPKMVYVLDISKLVAAGAGTTCSVDTIAEVWDGGHEPECPTLASSYALPDGTSGGPHWGTPDNFVKLANGNYTETKDIRRIAVSNYFVARTGVDGNHKVCMLDVSSTGKLSLDTNFRDENHGTPCVDFNRTYWPHGKDGNAKPHSELFVVPDASLQ
ncbi:MAG: hypothetical protein JOZ37_08765 [Actinobacteria bacterium]|nr:hypothetical protein [Actinomycetota bacterium]MBV8957347.1 hypothetical protein [Actinomycetota bacterium]MBV9664044.1 hypothetical protein [Actinomycetota bacterium]MBV9936625.1 hypothetical protein [Actinomycetota bacterium]